MNRGSGVLLHLSSLENEYGIGTMGKAAYDFVDFLNEAGQSYWQVLPLGQTGYGDSPYQSFSTFAGNPYFIDLDLLEEEGFLLKEEYQHLKELDQEKVNYGELYKLRYPVLKLAAKRFLEEEDDDYNEFKEAEKEWLEDYATYMAFKAHFEDKCWLDWPQAYRIGDKEAVLSLKEELKEEIEYLTVFQYLFFKQWRSLKEYANSKDILIIGDIPIYVALDSVDVWSNKDHFKLDEEGYPTEVSGCPPDAFSEDGQLWGSPIYDWKFHKETNYKWWINRISKLTEIYDLLRIDHFRGFDSYWSIPYTASSAKEGEWCKGPGIELFQELERQKGKLNIIAEDLGYLTDSVLKLLKDSGFPGMKVLEFAFDERESSSNAYLPHNYPTNCVVYCGTHDNSTIKGWMNSASKECIEHAKNYMLIKHDDDFVWNMLSIMYASVADIAIAQAQDLLELDDDARMNIPSTSSGNWMWRAPKACFDKALAAKLLAHTKRYGR